ncbi:sensor histidine kinase [Fretibacter rubidus]|uniref:sensor histidine kinase n=1 Tax=Fretibacter rubidus TaxID=570162 RepID=UPI00352A2DCE
MQDLRTRFGIILALALLPILLYALWLAFSTGRLAPVFLALASLLFAFIAVWVATDALVFKHLKVIERASRDFSTGDLSARVGALSKAPQRVQELAQSFDTMADTISQREAAMSDSLIEKEVLLREIHHRVKNNLQIIISLLNMQERKITDPSGLNVINEARNRINAIALVHRGLYEGDDLRVIDMQLFLDRLVHELKIGLGTDALDVSIETDFQAETFQPDTAIPIALFIVEALTNAIQHGVPGGGTVWISLKRDNEKVTVSVKDSGPGMMKNKKASTGSKLIKGFARQLSGRIKMDDTFGHHVSLIFKPGAL